MREINLEQFLLDHKEGDEKVELVSEWLKKYNLQLADTIRQVDRSEEGIRDIKVEAYGYDLVPVYDDQIEDDVYVRRYWVGDIEEKLMAMFSFDDFPWEVLDD